MGIDLEENTIGSFADCRTNLTADGPTVLSYDVILSLDSNAFMVTLIGHDRLLHNSKKKVLFSTVLNMEFSPFTFMFYNFV
jgi:hypothetical protein